jgi:hypothetical protein
VRVGRFAGLAIDGQEPLGQINQIFGEMRAGRILGRMVLKLA